MAGSSSSILDWKFSQVFGERSPGEDVENIDVISAIEFDKSGDYLAVGDRGGRVVIFEKKAGKDVKERKLKKVKEMDLGPYVSSENALLSERSFVSGESKSSVANGLSLEWIDKMETSISVSNAGHMNGQNIGETAFARCRKMYAHAHDYNINSISNNSDGETFISADDLRINLWNLEVSDQCFNIIDMKPPNMDDLTEVITSAEFHPLHCNLLAYSSSRGLHDAEPRGQKTFFTEIIASISSIKFAPDGRHILSRDYMNLKFWDMRMPTSPVVTYKIHDHLRPKLGELYNNDAIFDKFDCCLSGDGTHFATGSYSLAPEKQYDRVLDRKQLVHVLCIESMIK
ncbi:Protein phosphatase 2A, regulatory subunit PR55 [Cynara cardunculus var. scolymus]|uniref:Serine/threonine-protein phosphatase 2A 55 kDa regulatory subunit B n=1 Tax=Cynara cardunculus var. scolymus TaxID=59895 RepID=A0A103XXU8_CYNCS|nr:Protein phosphatase 2A, regulatory subunit PR55 [Cynara cardunculus var. scolymus]